MTKLLAIFLNSFGNGFHRLFFSPRIIKPIFFATQTPPSAENQAGSFLLFFASRFPRVHVVFPPPVSFGHESLLESNEIIPEVNHGALCRVSGLAFFPHWPAPPTGLQHLVLTAAEARSLPLQELALPQVCAHPQPVKTYKISAQCPRGNLPRARK